MATKIVQTYPLDTYVFVSKWYVLLRPLFYCLGRYAAMQDSPKNKRFVSRLFNKGSRAIATIQRNVGNASALHLMYQLRKKPAHGALERFWTTIPIIKAVQNRAVMVRGVVRDVIRHHNKQDGAVRILELAAGLSEPLLWALHDLKGDMSAPSVVLTDLSRGSLDDANAIASQLDIPLTTERLNLLKHTKVQEKIKDLNPNILEMIGFIDYLDDENVSGLLGVIQEALPDGATFIVGNVIPTWEQSFIESAYHWPKMYYRSSDHLRRLVEHAKFQNIRVHVEPAGCFAVIVCTV
jgi:Putative methyltransferase